MSHLSRRHLFMASAAALIGPGACASRTATPGQARADLYHCEGCEGARERDPAALTWRAAMAGPDEPGERMIILGRTLSADTGEPVPNVVIYAYQTNAEGLYANGTPETEWSRRHGRLRAWVRTGDDGRYRFDTIKPAPYPNTTLPAHVHLTVLEASYPPYYIDDIVFDGEVGVTPAYRAAQEFRGGGAIITPTRSDSGVLTVTRDIRLERHPD